MADDLDAVLDDDLARLGQLAVAAGLRRQIDDHRAGLHALDHLLGEQLRRRPARDQRGGDDDVLLLQVLGNDFGLLALELVRHLLGVTRRGLGILHRAFVDHDELAAKAFDLLLGRRADVRRGDDRAEPLGRGDGLQAGDADAHDEDPGRRNRAAGRHHQRERTAELRRGVDRRLVAGEVVLAGQDVHRLRPRDPGHQFHGERRQPGLGVSFDILAMCQRGQGCDQHRPALHHRDFVQTAVHDRPLDLDHHVGVADRGRLVLGDGGAGGLELGVRDRRVFSGSLLDNDVEAEAHEFLHHIRRSGDPGLSGHPFSRYRYFHFLSPRCLPDAETGVMHGPARRHKLS